LFESTSILAFPSYIISKKSPSSPCFITIQAHFDEVGKKFTYLTWIIFQSSNLLCKGLKFFLFNVFEEINFVFQIIAYSSSFINRPLFVKFLTDLVDIDVWIISVSLYLLNLFNYLFRKIISCGILKVGLSKCNKYLRMNVIFNLIVKRIDDSIFIELFLLQ
jgi:hypothetical protein